MEIISMPGKVEVFTSSNGGHSAEFFAERLTKRIIDVSETAPEPIRLQALYYRDTMYTLILETIRAAMKSAKG